MIYEALIVTAVLFVATAAFTTIFGDSSAQPMHFLLQFYLFIVGGLYFVSSWTGGRRTLPMRTWRMRLVDETGRNLGVRQAAMRYTFAAFGVAMGGLGVFWAFLDRDRQFLHDRLARTRLVADAHFAPPD